MSITWPSGAIVLRLREKSTGNLLALEPSDKAGERAEFAIAAAYPQDLLLVAIGR